MSILISIAAGCNIEVTHKISIFDHTVSAIKRKLITEREVRNSVKHIFMARYISFAHLLV